VIRLLVIAAVLCPPPLAAQAIRGRVLAAADGAPVVGAFVSLLDGGGEVAASFLTDEAGSFRVRGRSAGPHTLRVRMIGFAAHTSATFELAGGETITRTLTLSTEPISLEGITASGERVCRFDASEAVGAAALWEEATKALEALAWTASRETLTYRIALSRRVSEQGTGRLIQEEADTLRSVGARPFSVGDPDSLFEHGFVLPGPGGGPVYYGPDAEMLLSPRFLETHCFRVVGDGDEIGLEFEPKPGRAVTDLEGVIWLDRHSGHLRRVEFSFEGGRAVTTGSGGEVHFRRLGDGRWIIQRWRLRAPIVSGDPFSRRRHSPLIAFDEATGEVVEVMDRSGSPVH
jgi:hypothetical protein